MTPRRIVWCLTYLAVVVGYCTAFGLLRYLASILALLAGIGVFLWLCWTIPAALRRAGRVLDDLLADIDDRELHVVREGLPEPRRVQ